MEFTTIVLMLFFNSPVVMWERHIAEFASKASCEEVKSQITVRKNETYICMENVLRLPKQLRAETKKHPAEGEGE